MQVNPCLEFERIFGRESVQAWTEVASPVVGQPGAVGLATGELKRIATRSSGRRRLAEGLAGILGHDSARAVGQCHGAAQCVGQEVPRSCDVRSRQPFVDS
jgi:hypothetical protein